MTQFRLELSLKVGYMYIVPNLLCRVVGFPVIPTFFTFKLTQEKS